MRIVFFGTPLFAKTILEYLIAQELDIAAVVCRPDKPQKRSQTPVFSEVKKCALAHGLPCYQPNKASDPEFAAFLKTLNADFFIVAAYAEILKENLLGMPRYACLNVHGSILPQYRGPAPVQRALMNGEHETGITIMKMAAEVDAGDVYAIKKIAIPLEMNAGELFAALAEIGKTALYDVMKKIMDESIKALAQDATKATSAKKIKKEEAKINWQQSCVEIHNLVRAVTPNPGAWCWVEIHGERKRLGIKKTLPMPQHAQEPGDLVVATPTELIIACKEGALRVLELQLEGKKVLSSEQFLRGISRDKIKFLLI